MIKILYENNKFKNEIEYIFNIIKRNLGINIKFSDKKENFNEEDIIINYSDEKLNRKNTINILQSNLFSEIYLEKESIPTEKIEIYNDTPIIYKHNQDEPYVEKKENIIDTNIDIIQSIFFMLTRYEEVVLWDDINKDLYNRFPASESLAYKENFLHIPIVDEYIEWFWKWLKYAGYKGVRKEHFHNYDFVACLTHDVDRPFKYTNSLVEHLKSFENSTGTFLDFKGIIKHTISNIDYTRDPFFTFDYIRKIEKRYEYKSSFYFMSGGNTCYENFYNIDDKRVVSLINKLKDDECEVGYHYSFNAHDDLEMRKAEKEKLDNIFNCNRYGGRNHFLRFTPLESWRISEKVGLLYDTTLSYADYTGFRCGTCFPYKPYDMEKRKEINILEIPLIVMEGTLADKKYRNLDCEESFEEIKKYINTVKKYKGVFTLLWHNSSFDNEEWSGWKNIFERTMKLLYENNALGTSGLEVSNMFTDRNDINEKNIDY